MNTLPANNSRLHIRGTVFRTGCLTRL